MMNFAGKTAVVTGGSRGIGRAICEELARGGANVVLCYAGRAEAAQETAAAPGLMELRQGDMVRHKSFGQGMVLSVRRMGNDALIEVAFDQVGTKKLMLRAAGPHMEKL